METTQRRSAVAAASATAAALGLKAREAMVLHDSNRLAVRLLPCDVLVRVAPVADRASAAFEVGLAQRLAETDSPVAGLDRRVEPLAYVRDGFVITFWDYYEPVSLRAMPPSEYAQALERLHAGLRTVDVTVPHFTDRVAEAQSLIASRAQTPALADADRELLSTALRQLREAAVRRGAPEQLLHGEPHPGNLLATKRGPLFIDLQTSCRGPVEFDIAHAPDDVAQHYPGLDAELLGVCRLLKLAMVAAWRWDRDDQLPNGLQMGLEYTAQVRAALAGAGKRRAPPQAPSAV